MASPLILHYRWAAGGLCALACMTAAVAQPLHDPTRPPAAMTQPADGTSDVDGPVLQSILVSPQRRFAVISGRTVQEGDTVGNARVARIADTQVFLRVGNEVRVLHMYPDIRKEFAATSVRASKQKQ